MKKRRKMKRDETNEVENEKRRQNEVKNKKG
jgi:hypothetical protein